MRKTITSNHIVVVALGIGAVLSLVASPHPDGLEKTAEDIGFFERTVSEFGALMPEYLMPGVGNELLGTAVAGVVGTLVTGAILYALGRDLFRVRV